MRWRQCRRAWRLTVTGRRPVSSVHNVADMATTERRRRDYTTANNIFIIIFSFIGIFSSFLGRIL